MWADPTLMTHHHFLFLVVGAMMVLAIAVVVLASMVLSIPVMVPVVREVGRLTNPSVLLRQQIVQLDVERCHWTQLLKHLCQQLLEVFLRLSLTWWQLLHAWGRVEDWAEEVDDVGLLLTVLVEAFEEIGFVVASEQALDLVNSAFGKLCHELLPIAMLYLQESSQVVRLKQHETDEASVKLLVTFNLILELASLVPVKLLFVHRQS